MGADVFAGFEQVILEKIGTPRHTGKENVGNPCKLLVDETVAEQTIRYPNYLSLLNEARKISELLIDELYTHSDYKKKPRTYRRKARK